ncbi:MAG: J domain-containing protein, partial [Thermoplasmata archaeon]
LFVQVQVEPVAGFRREGREVYSEARVPLVTALLGGDVQIHTLLGDALLTVPAGTQPASQFRLRGEGFPRLRGGDRGDHIVTLRVEIPKGLDSHQKELLREALGRPGPAGGAPRRSGGIFSRRSG